MGLILLQRRSLTERPGDTDLIALIDRAVAAELQREAPGIAARAVYDVRRRIAELRRSLAAAGASPWRLIRRTGETRAGLRLSSQAEAARLLRRARYALASPWWSCFDASTLDPAPLPQAIDPIHRLQIDPSDPFLAVFRDLLLERRGNLFLAAVQPIIDQIAAGRIALEGRRTGPASLDLTPLPAAVLGGLAWRLERAGTTGTPTLSFTGHEPHVRWDGVRLAGGESGAAVTAAPPEPNKPKRRPTGLDYYARDLPLMLEMKQMVDSGQASGPWDAARAVANRAAGAGVESSKVSRLYSHFKKFTQS